MKLAISTIRFDAVFGVIGIQYICHFTSSDMGYYQFYSHGYSIQLNLIYSDIISDIEYQIVHIIHTDLIT